MLYLGYMKTQILKKYEIRIESNKMFDEEEPVLMHSVYATNGGYVGRVEDAAFYFEKGIMPELSPLNQHVCSIGKSNIDGKWYGWSHRAIFGFEIGDTVKEGDCTASSGWTEEYLKEHPEENQSLPVGFTAKTEEDAKKMAIAFADSVS